jgi:hypothetical protein
MTIIPITPSRPEADSDQLEAIYAKISFRIVPFLMVLWVIAWIDRVNVGFASSPSPKRSTPSECGEPLGRHYLGEAIGYRGQDDHKEDRRTD